MRFFVGLHQPNHAKHFERSMISVNRLRHRRLGFKVNEWIMDSGAFSELSQHGRYRHPTSTYAYQVRRWAKNGRLLAAVTQDYMCEPFILKITGLTVKKHQELTIERYDALVQCGTNGVYVLPVLQGYTPSEYLEHIHMYGNRIQQGMWVGVGSICKRNGTPKQIVEVLKTIKEARPDLRLHGFGVKTTGLSSRDVCDLLATADSMAWSFAARREGRDANCWQEALAFVQRIEGQVWMAMNVAKQRKLQFAASAGAR